MVSSEVAKKLKNILDLSFLEVQKQKTVFYLLNKVRSADLTIWILEKQSSERSLTTLVGTNWHTSEPSIL